MISSASSFAALKAQREARRNPLSTLSSAAQAIQGSSDQHQHYGFGSASATGNMGPPATPVAMPGPSNRSAPSNAFAMSSRPTPDTDMEHGQQPSPVPQRPAPSNANASANAKKEPGAAGSRVRLPDVQDLELRFDPFSSERALFYAPLPKNGLSPAHFSISSSSSAFSPANRSRSFSGSMSYSYSQLLSSSYSAPGGWAAAGITSCRPGDVLLRVRPEVAVLSTALLEQRCSACYSPRSVSEPIAQQAAASTAGKLQRCSGCKVVRYCSSACQRRDWPTHRDECKALKAMQQLHTYRSALRQLDQPLANRFAQSQGGSAPFNIGSFQDNDEVVAAAAAGQLQGNESDDDSGLDRGRGGAGASSRSSNSSKDRIRLPSSMMRALARWIWARSRIGGGSGKDKARGERGDLLELCSHRERFAPEELQQQAQLALHLAQYLTAAARASATLGPVTRGEAHLDEMLQPESTLSQGDALRAVGIDSAKELLDLVCQFASNSFTLTDSDLNPLGVCMHPSMAMINHACTPNAAVVFPFGGAAKNGQQKWNDGEDRIMQLVALRAIEPGEELLISYVDIADTYQDRRNYLKKRYCFDCRCELCRKSQAKLASASGQPFASPSSSPMQHAPQDGFGVRPPRPNNWIDPRHAVWCPKRCGAWIDGSAMNLSDSSAAQASALSSTLVAKCSKCHSASQVTPTDVAEDTRLAIDVLKQASRLLDRGESELAWNQCAAILPGLVERYPPSWQPLFQLLRLATTCLIEVGSTLLSLDPADASKEQAAAYCLDEAVRMQMLVVAGTQASNTPVYPKGHPARAIAIATLAKLVLAQLDNTHRMRQREAGDFAGGAALQMGGVPNAAVCRAAVQQTAARADQRTLSILKNAPSVPEEMRVELAQQMLTQAIEELDIAFGRSNQGGRTGREMRKALSEMEQEIALLKQTSSMSVS
ncbi:hypothetical protein NDA10_004179 [Ustilago hordei]|nr:hypothetical protein NDA10_004179 [Ustilago hordei]KAJ1573121.1 hypothetical protein NDA12_006272 [Ustilago hordei]KAJ1582219.1 hypothetical protein NDA15_005719 [Ustilago hordei]